MNSLNELILFTAIGKLFIFLWMEFPISGWLEDNKFIGGLHRCDLCSGVWIFTILFLIFRIDVLHLLDLPYYPIVGEIITGGSVSFVVHLLSIGFKDKFMSFIIE